MVEIDATADVAGLSLAACAAGDASTCDILIYHLISFALFSLWLRRYFARFKAFVLENHLRATVFFGHVIVLFCLPAYIMMWCNLEVTWASVGSLPLFLLVLLRLVLLFACVGPKHIATIDAVVGPLYGISMHIMFGGLVPSASLLLGHISVLCFGCWLRCPTEVVCGCCYGRPEGKWWWRWWCWRRRQRIFCPCYCTLSL